MHRWILMCHNLVSDINNKLTCSIISTQITFHIYRMSKTPICLSIPAMTQEPSPRLHLNPMPIWWPATVATHRGKAYEYHRRCIPNRWWISLRGRCKGAILMFDFGFPEPSLMQLHPGREVTYCICDVPATISGHSILSPNIASAGSATLAYISSVTTARTLNSDVRYFSSLSHKWSPVSSHSGCVNSSSFICFCRKLSERYCTELEIVPIT